MAPQFREGLLDSSLAPAEAEADEGGNALVDHATQEPLELVGKTLSIKVSMCTW